MKTNKYSLNYNQMQSPVIDRLFDCKKAGWVSESWNGKNFDEGFANMTQEEVNEHNEICDENCIEYLKIENEDDEQRKYS